MSSETIIQLFKSLNYIMRGFIRTFCFDARKLAKTDEEGTRPRASEDVGSARSPAGGFLPGCAQNGMSSSISLLRAPAATARRGAATEGPLEPKSPPESSGPTLPPPPLRPSSMVSVELKPCSTTSVEYFSTPAWSVHLRVCSAPSL